MVPQKWIDGLKTWLKHLTGKTVRTDYIKNHKKRKDTKLYEYKKTATSICNETIAEMMHTSLPKLVHHQDRNAMAHSIESRAPFLDYRLVEFVFNLPGEYKVNLGVTKYVMRNGLKDILPEDIKNRMDKLGFATPEDVWIRENKAQFRVLLENACDAMSTLVEKQLLLLEFDRQVEKAKHLDGIFWCVICVAAWKNAFGVLF